MSGIHRRHILHTRRGLIPAGEIHEPLIQRPVELAVVDEVGPEGVVDILHPAGIRVLGLAVFEKDDLPAILEQSLQRTHGPLSIVDGAQDVDADNRVDGLWAHARLGQSGRILDSAVNQPDPSGQAAFLCRPQQRVMQAHARLDSIDAGDAVGIVLEVVADASTHLERRPIGPAEQLPPVSHALGVRPLAGCDEGPLVGEEGGAPCVEAEEAARLAKQHVPDGAGDGAHTRRQDEEQRKDAVP